MEFIIILATKYLFILPVILGLVFVYFQNKRTRLNIISLLIISFPISLITAKILGKIYYNPRPFVVENIKPLVAHVSNNGFPSDHTLLAMTIAAVVFSYNRKIGLLFILLAILVGYARVAAKIHHQIDIWGAVLIAGAAVYFSRFILKKFLKFKT